MASISKRWLINYVLLAAIIVLTWIGYQFPIREDQKLSQKLITPLKAADIDRLRIENADELIDIEKTDGRWMIIRPIRWYGNKLALDRLVTLAEQPLHSKLASSQIDLSTIGLRIPRAIVTLNDTAIAFGTTNRIGNRRYLLIPPNVYLVDDLHYAFVSQGLAGLVDPRLLPPALDLAALKLPAASIERVGDGWRSDRGNSNAATRLIDNWRQLQAGRVKPYRPRGTPLQKIIATTGDGRQIEFFVLSIQPEVVIARPDLGLQYHFSDSRYYDLLALDRPAAG
jgi:hypothetical protein